MTTIVFVHGGEVWQSQEEYMSFLQNSTRKPYEAKRGWKETIAERLSKYHDVFFPQFPCKQNAVYEEWKIFAEAQFYELPDEVIWIGHSLGGVFLARYLLETKKRGKALHLVAPPFSCPSGFHVPENFSSLPQQIKETHLWASRDDEVVVWEEISHYLKKAPWIQLHEFHDRGHFVQEEFPEFEASLIAQAS